jgi:cytoskeletal protein CcmA (bactofilin family)
MFKKSQNSFSRSMEFFETMVGEHAEIHGRLVTSESLRIDGKLIGNVEATQENKVSVALGKSGQIQGDIYAYRVFIAGKVDGNIYCTERVELHDGAIVNGDISYEQIAIEPGAKLNGLMICRNKDVSVDFQKGSEIFQNNWNRITKE